LPVSTTVVPATVGSDTIETRTLTDADVLLIGHMREAVLGWDQRLDYVRQAVRSGHAVGTFSDGGLVGFRYQHALLPDVLGDGLILVHPAWRERGVGKQLVTEFERCAPERFRLSVVLNTDLLASRTPKADATRFWLSCGYELVTSTGPSRLLVRPLPN